MLALELALRGKDGEVILVNEYLPQFPQYAEQINAVFGRLDTVSVQKSFADGVPAPQGAGHARQRERFGRYQVAGVLGSGGFAVVYKGLDPELGREVAIKVPHRRRISRPEDAEAYVAEARMVAGLDHPHIVPVHDVGRTDDGLCFVVSKSIAGRNLREKIREGRLSFDDTADLVARVADALHYAHLKGLVHRDIKPENILIDTAGKPYVADFGLALKEEDYGKGPERCGTPAYMSPEQAKGEAHRVDGRSDVFSLGAVLYELLTGRRPFLGNSYDEIVSRVIADEPRRPRQIDHTIPRKLERICLKALRKKTSDRYATAKEMAADLRTWSVERWHRRWRRHRPRAAAD